MFPTVAALYSMLAHFHDSDFGADACDSGLLETAKASVVALLRDEGITCQLVAY